MLKITERVGDKETTYEADTVQDLVALRNAINTQVLPPKGDGTANTDQTDGGVNQ